MKFTRILLILLLSCLAYDTLHAAYDPKLGYDPSAKSVINTNPSDPKYYNNDPKANALIAANPALQAYAQNNSAALNQAIKDNNWQCGQLCVAALTASMNSATPSGPTNTTNAGPTPANGNGANAQAGAPTKVYVTEKVPGATCWCNIGWVRQWSAWESCGRDIPVEKRKYECDVGKWLSAFQEMFRSITRWVVYVTMLLWVFAIAWAGIMWAFGSDSEEYTKKAKWWVMNIIIGLIILFTFRYILWFLAPWIFE
jgi:hypothetical protein